MKILHINCNYLTTVLHQTMVEHLQERGVENTVFAPTYDAKLSVIDPHENVIVSRCFHRRDRYIFHYKQRKIQKAVESATDVKGFDCIHAYTLFTDGNCARKLSRKYALPYVVAVRSTDVNTFFKKMKHLRGLGVEILRDASAVYFLSQPYREQVLNRYVPKEYREEILQKSYIVGNGIDPFWLENPVSLETVLPVRLNRIKNRELRIVFAGRVNKNKNPLTTMDACNILRERGWKVQFVVVGKVEDQQVLKKLEADSNTGYISQKPKEELLNIYRENDIFVMPSYKETFGLVYAEAMSQGLPVIYTRGQGFDGQLPEGTAGYAVDPSDPTEIADRVENIAGNYTEMAENAKVCAAKFNWNDICETYKEHYEKISGNHGGTAL